MGSTSSSDLIHTVTVYMPMTDVGTHVSGLIVEDMKATTELNQMWVPPTVRPRPNYR